jgi:hypothetical protein
MDKPFRKAKVMSRETGNRVVPAFSANPPTGEAKDVSVAGSSALLIDYLDAREENPAPYNGLCGETERLPQSVYLTRKRRRATRLIDPVEDSLYLLFLAVVLGYLLIAFLGL